MYSMPYLLSIKIYLQKIWFISSFSIGGFMNFSVSMRSSSLATFLLVEQIFCFCRFMWTLSVAGQLSGKYFCTAEYVIPGHVVKWFLAIALRRVDFVRKKNTDGYIGLSLSWIWWCRNYFQYLFWLLLHRLYFLGGFLRDRHAWGLIGGPIKI